MVAACGAVATLALRGGVAGACDAPGTTVTAGVGTDNALQPLTIQPRLGLVLPSEMWGRGGFSVGIEGWSLLRW